MVALAATVASTQDLFLVTEILVIQESLVVQALLDQQTQELQDLLVLMDNHQ
jgi:hypothetical protein